MHRAIKAPHHLGHAARIVASVLLICACNTARMCRVSTQITGKPTSARALKSHCERGPASGPIRLRRWIAFQNLQQGCRQDRYLHFPHDLARVFHNADAGLLDRTAPGLPEAPTPEWME
jgi:hypothetical protein